MVVFVFRQVLAKLEAGNTIVFLLLQKEKYDGTIKFFKP